MKRRAVALAWILVACSCKVGSVEVGEELTRMPVALGYYTLAAEEGGFVVAWSELRTDADEEMLVFARIDRSGRFVRPPRDVVPLERAWMRLRVVTTETGYVVFHWHPDDLIHAAVLDSEGVLVSDVVSEGRTDSSAHTSMASLSSWIGVSWRRSGTLYFRPFDDQGVPRAATVTVGARKDPAMLALGDRVRLYASAADGLHRLDLDANGAIVTPSEMLAPGAFTDTTAAAVTEGTFVGMVTEDGAYFLLVRDDGSGWAEPKQLVPPNRRESFNYDMAAANDVALVVWQSDLDAALPQLFAATIDVGADAEALEMLDPLTPPGLRAGSPFLAADSDGAGVLFSVTEGGSSHLYFRYLALPRGG